MPRGAREPSAAAQLLASLLFLATTPSNPPRHLVGIWGEPDPAAPFFFVALLALLLPAAVAAALLLGLGRQKDLLDARSMLRSRGATQILALLAIFGNVELLRLLPWSHARMRNSVGIELVRCVLMARTLQSSDALQSPK